MTSSQGETSKTRLYKLPAAAKVFWGLKQNSSSSSIYFGVSINKILFIIPKGHKIIEMRVEMMVLSHFSQN